MNTESKVHDQWTVWLLGNRDRYGWTRSISIPPEVHGRTNVIEYVSKDLAEGEHRIAMLAPDGDLAVVSITVETKRIVQLTAKLA